MRIQSLLHDLANLQIAQQMEEGKRYLRQDRYDPWGLRTAGGCFLAAYDLARHGGTPDHAASVLALYQVMSVKIEMSYNKKLSAEENLAHLDAGRDFGRVAFEHARYVLTKANSSF